MGLVTHLTKGTLFFATKAWFTLVYHKLSTTKQDNVLSPKKDVLVTSIVDGYKINVDNIIVREIYD